MNSIEEQEPGTPEEVGPGKGVVRASEILPDDLFIVPLTARPFFPGIPVPLLISKPAVSTRIQSLLEANNNTIGLLLQKQEPGDQPINDFYPVGVAAKILRVFSSEDGGVLQLLLNCVERFKIQEMRREENGIWARVEYHYAPEYSVNPELKAYSMAIISTLKDLSQLSPIHLEAIKIFLQHSSMEDPGRVADFAANLTTADAPELQSVLETFDVRERIDKVLLLLRKELEMTRLQQKITKQIEERITKQQREFFLREQLKSIKQELGLEKEGKTAEIETFNNRIKELKLTPEVQRVIAEEMDKFQILERMSPEYMVTRNYLDWLTILPWGKYSKDRFSVSTAREILNRDHYGLEDVKDRILEFIAVGKLKGNISGSILCLIGPPGVGKTSVGKSIAEALNRKFFRFSLGGIRDEAEIKGHRRTYIGAMPGKFIQAMKTVGTANPVIMLDEIDKTGVSFQGDPASALLEVLDPEQNNSFRDHYLDVPYDLSDVFFIATANQMDTIPAPLLDRMEVIRLSGYILQEKVEIAARYLVPKALEAHGIRKDQVTFKKDALVQLIDGYAREAGVRSLEKQIRTILRKCAVILAGGKKQKIIVKKEDLESYLGKPSFLMDQVLEGRAGVVTGLAWTSMGGATLQVEATAVHTKARGFKQTGQLGQVMVESSEIAYTYVMGHAAEYGVDAAFFDEHFVHVHVPAGATPKDGPSAGVTMAAALVSMLRQRPAIPGLAMTGELTLTGQVLPVGGIKEKVIAARRAGRKVLLMPEENRKDFEELPEYLREGLAVHFASDFKQIEQAAFPEPERP